MLGAWEGEAPAEPRNPMGKGLSGSFALPFQQAPSLMFSPRKLPM